MGARQLDGNIYVMRHVSFVGHVVSSFSSLFCFLVNKTIVEILIFYSIIQAHHGIRITGMHDRQRKYAVCPL